MLCFYINVSYAEKPLNNNVRGWIPVQNLINHSNFAKLHIRMLPSTIHHLGDETMKIQITSSEIGYLFLLDINSNGQLTRIFPNQYVNQNLRIKKGFIKAGQTIVIPDDSYGFNFKAVKPVGNGLLVAFLIEEEFVDGVVLPKEFESITTTQTYSTLKQLNNYLNEMLETDDSIGRPIRWSITTLDYKITN